MTLLTRLVSGALKVCHGILLRLLRIGGCRPLLLRLEGPPSLYPLPWSRSVIGYIKTHIDGMYDVVRVSRRFAHVASLRSLRSRRFAHVASIAHVGRLRSSATPASLLAAPPPGVLAAYHASPPNTATRALNGRGGRLPCKTTSRTYRMRCCRVE